jgi:hypothetical protein
MASSQPGFFFAWELVNGFSFLGSARIADGSRFLGSQNLLLETVHAAFRVDQLLLPGKEGVAVGANFDADVAFVGSAGTKRIVASADDVYFFVCGVDSGFHN